MSADIKEQLAQLADEMPVSSAPVDALVRGGRRRRARRRVAVAAAAVAFTLPVGGALVWTQSGGGERPLHVGTQPTQQPGVLQPVTTILAKERVGGEVWELSLTMYAAPRTQQEALAQWDLAGKRNDMFPDSDPEDIFEPPRKFTLDRPWFVAEFKSPIGAETAAYVPSSPGAEEARITSLNGGNEDKPASYGWVGSEVDRVKVTWADGSTSEPQLITPTGADIKWFFAVSPDRKDPVHVDLYDATGERTRITPDAFVINFLDDRDR
ncbi:hypothetical protein ACIBI4_21155 [Streptomyces sp. NPDC050418]|uniref:hypothetical protein n=1 Tax=Streptomyces sp. NPDC050418 TaxID=3365612 RepID=UPI0037BCA072